MLDEKKGTCCHKCGHVHVKGTSCPKPFLKGEKSCTRRANEAALSTHYKERKAERGVINSVTLPKEAYSTYNAQETNAKLLLVLQSELDKRFLEIEKPEFNISKNYNLGYRFFMPVLVSGESKYPIKMDTSKGTGHYYFAIVMDGTLVTVMLSSKTKEGVLDQIEEHVKRTHPNNTKAPKVISTEDFIYEIDIDSLYGIEKEKSKEEKISEEDLDYVVRTDYRTGAIFNHKKFGKGTIVATSSGVKGTGDIRGVVDWVDVKYDKPYVKSGKLETVRRFPKVYTSVYFGKTLKEMSLQNPGAEELLTYLDKHPDIRQTLGFTSTEGVRDYIETLNPKGWYDFVEEVEQVKKELDETDTYCPTCLKEYLLEYRDKIEEAEYRGRKVKLGKPFLTPDGPKKRSVYVKNAKGNVIKVNFGDPNLKIKKSNPKRRKSFRARHKCHTAKDRTTPRYWSCKFW